MSSPVDGAENRSDAAQGEILYGRQPVLESLRARRRQIRRVVLADTARPCHELNAVEALCRQSGIPLERETHRWFDRLGPGLHHQGVVAEAGPFPYSAFKSVMDAARAAAEPPLVLLLDRIEDPQNLGSLLRSAEATGTHAVILPERGAVRVTPAAVRASAGAAERVSVVVVPNLARAIASIREAGLQCIGLETAPEARPLFQTDLSGPVAVVVGSEGRGITRLVRESCDALATIPLHGHVNSLNAAVAGAIALYEARRQRSAAPGTGPATKR